MKEWRLLASAAAIAIAAGCGAPEQNGSTYPDAVVRSNFSFIGLGGTEYASVPLPLKAGVPYYDGPVSIVTGIKNSPLTINPAQLHKAMEHCGVDNLPDGHTIAIALVGENRKLNDTDASPHPSVVSYTEERTSVSLGIKDLFNHVQNVLDTTPDSSPDQFWPLAEYELNTFLIEGLCQAVEIAKDPLLNNRKANGERGKDIAKPFNKRIYYGDEKPVITIQETK